MFSPSRFQFLNEAGELLDVTDWNDQAKGKLWLYNLHYFDDLSAKDATSRANWHFALIARWIADNPPSQGIGWDPYPTSLRIVNWIKWAASGNRLPIEFDRSLALQARWLATHIEHHLLANHLLANAKALVFAGLYFEGIEAARWCQNGLAILNHELPEQILIDGGHFERSPMYHALVLEDLLDLINISREATGAIDQRIVSGWCGIAERMFGWLTALSHPDGQIAFFNDAAFGIAPAPGELAAYASRLGLHLQTELTSLSDSGYQRAELGGAVLLADLAPVGASYQPGHAHADTLSFELSISGQRIFVNSGTSTYRPGPQRHFERSTAAHNTVEIDDKDSSEVWGTFRVARRAWPQEVFYAASEDSICIRGSHDGYLPLGGGVTHSREWLLEKRRLRLTDWIAGRFERAVARFYIHPLIRPQDDQRLLMPNGRLCRWSVVGGEARLVQAQWHPEFGRSERNHCVEIIFNGNQSILELVW